MNTKKFILSLLSSVSIFSFPAAAQNIASPAAPDNFSWTSGTTLQVPFGCEYTSGGASAITTGHMGAVACDTNRDVLVNVINANANGSATSANSSPVVLASDQSAADHCMFQKKTTAAFGTSGTTNVQLVAPVDGQQVYICSMLLGGAAAHYNLIGGTGTDCTSSNEEALVGSTTAANGVPVAASAGWTLGNGGGQVVSTITSGNGVCVLTDASVQFAGTVSYVQQ